MANESRSRQSRTPATPQNSATMGVILVIAAVVIAILLFNAGGGESKADDTDKTAAESATGDSGSTTTSALPVAVTTPPASLEVVVGNGSGVPGRAKATAERLGTVGYTNTKFVDGNPSPNTVVFFSPGHDADALALTQLLSLTDDRAQPLPAQTPLKEAVPTAALTVLVGADFDPATASFTTTTVGPTN